MRLLVLLSLVTFFWGCASNSDEATLLVDLQTDYVPGVEFHLVEVAVIPFGGTTELPSSATADVADVFVVPRRVAEYPNLPTGETTVRVRLRDEELGLVTERHVTLDFAATRGVVVMITRDCAEVSCPAIGDSATLTECFAGRCVPPSCAADARESCGPAVCSTDTDCPSVSSCAAQNCSAGACFASVDHSLCGPGEVCHPDLGCVASVDSGMPPTDAGADSGMPDSATSDSAVPDAGMDAAADATVDATADVGTDAVVDAGCTDPFWGVADDDTTDVAGDIFGTQTWMADVCVVPTLGERVPLEFRARITAMGTEFSWDIFGTSIMINGVGGYRDTLMTWTYVTVTGSAFADYTLSLPADIDGDGTVDWTAGTNAIEIRTWSDYNARPSKSGLDYMRLGRP